MTTIRINTTPGTEYDYAPSSRHPETGQVDRHPLGRYRVLGVAREGRTCQELVIYEGMTGNDTGFWFACPVADFTTKFIAVIPYPPPPEPPVEVVEKVSGYSSEPWRSGV